MKFQLVPAIRGLTWLRQGFAVFFIRPLGFAGLFSIFLFAMLLAQLIPLIGPLLFLASLPLATLIFMLATHQTLQGQFPTPELCIAPLRKGKAQSLTLLKLGLVYAAVMLLILTLSNWIDGGRAEALQAAMASGKATPEQIVALASDSRLQFGLLSFIGLSSLLSLPFWHAPALVHWGNLGIGKALFFSAIACWRNLGAFIVYSLAWVGVLMAFFIVTTLLFALLGQPKWAGFGILVPAILLFWTVFYASLYFTFADCFEIAAPDEGLSKDN